MTSNSDRDPIREVEVLRRRFGKAINPSFLQEHMGRMQEMNKRIQEAINPPALKAFVDLGQTFSMIYGPRFTGYAESVGRSVVERANRVPELDSAEEEARYRQQFESLKLTPTELTVLYWVFGVTVSVLAAGAAGLSEEAARSLQTLLGFLMFFLAVESRFRR